MEPETFGQYATPARLPGVLVKSAVPTFRHGASVRCFDYFVVHHAVACQVREVRVLEESGVSPHHPVQMKLKRSAVVVRPVWFSHRFFIESRRVIPHLGTRTREGRFGEPARALLVVIPRG